MTQYSTSTVFILAPRRHGSSKVQSMLAAKTPLLHGPHPPVPRQAFMNLESALGKHLMDAMVHNANLNPHRSSSTVARLHIEDVNRELAERALPANALGIYLAMCHLDAKRSGQKEARILCTSPDNLTVVEQFKGQFKDTSLIHLLRDPRAVWNCTRGTKYGAKTPHESALKWADFHTRARQLSSTFPLLTVHYEELILRPNTQLKQACHFLNIPFNAEMLEDHGLVLKKTGKSLVEKHLGAWRHELPREEIRIIENSCADAMKAFGYAPICAEKQLNDEDKRYTPQFITPTSTGEAQPRQWAHLEKLSRLSATD